MNRRKFLQSLAALGAALAVPLDTLATASESVIDAAWEAGVENPTTFYVSPWGTISFAAQENWQQSRQELLGYSLVSNREELLDLASDEWRGDDLLAGEWAACIEDDEEATSDADWRTWLARQDTETVDRFIALANAWVEDDADESDWEMATLRGHTDQGAAMSYFQYDFEYCDDFNIEIVEGDHPGSSYFAAELRMDVDEANALAKELNLPIRFAWSGD